MAGGRRAGPPPATRRPPPTRRCARPVGRMLREGPRRPPGTRSGTRHRHGDHRPRPGDQRIPTGPEAPGGRGDLRPADAPPTSRDVSPATPLNRIPRVRLLAVSSRRTGGQWLQSCSRLPCGGLVRHRTTLPGDRRTLAVQPDTACLIRLPVRRRSPAVVVEVLSVRADWAAAVAVAGVAARGAASRYSPAACAREQGHPSLVPHVVSDPDRTPPT